MIHQIIRGAGGGGSKSSSSSSASTQRAAVIAADSLTSTQYARVLDLVSEGEIEGLVHGHQSVFFDDTPLQNADGSYNFKGFTIETRNGAVVQSHIGGFPATEALLDSSIGEVKNGSPLTRQVTGVYYDAVRIMVTIPRLSHQDASTGDVTGNTVSLQVEVKEGAGSWSTVLSDSITGKCTSPYSRDYRINLPGDGPWTIRLTKTSANSDDYNYRDLQWATLTGIIDAKFSYPNSALVGITIDSSQFNSIPSRGYDLKGLRIKVPSNYDPITRVYSGIWDGTFKIAWSDNPAWCFYDLLTNPRYGLGEFVAEYQVDKANLYTIGRYCDQLVPDGFGGTEPRFTCNMYLQTREEAFKVLSDMSGLFAGMLFWASGGLSCTQDAPTDAVHQFTNSNVIDGLFTYNGSSRAVRHTTALVSYNDPLDNYRRKVEYVEDEEGIKRYGVRQAEMVAIGCASRGQAHRMGKRVLLSERFLTETVTFKTGLEQMRCYPGAVIKIMDNNRAGARLGGRVRSATTGEVTLDAPVTLETGQSYILSILRPDGQIEERGIVAGDGETQVLTTTLPFTTAPNAQSVWVLTSTTMDVQLFKVLSIKELDGLIYEITALAYNPSKFDAIDLGTKFEPLETTIVGAKPAEKLPAPTGLGYEVNYYIDQNGAYRPKVTLHWNMVPSPYVASYVASYRYGSGTWRVMPDSATTTLEIEDATPGAYEFNVAGVSILGRPGNVASTSFVVPSIDPTSVYSAPVVALSKPWDGQDLEFEWGALPRTRGYFVRISSGSTVIRSFETTELRYTYRFAQMMADQADVPARSLLVEVCGVAASGAYGAYGQITATNAQMAAAPAPSIDEGVQAFVLSVPKPTKGDYAGTIFWASQTNGFTPSDANKIYDGPATSFMHMGTGNWFFKAAYYDLFGKDGLNISDQNTGSSFNAAGLPNVSTLPSNPSEVGGQQVVFLLSDKKLYRWNGTVYTRELDGGDLIPDSILAEHIASIDLKAISASFGELETGRMKVDNTGYIRGGQPAFNTGAGFWLGYDSSSYKFSLGNILSDSLTFDENGLTIYGNLNIESGTYSASTANSNFDSGLLNWHLVGSYGNVSAAATTFDSKSCASLTFGPDASAGQNYATTLISDKFPVVPGQPFSAVMEFRLEGQLNTGATYTQITAELYGTNAASVSADYISSAAASTISYLGSQENPAGGTWIIVQIDGVIPAGLTYASYAITINGVLQ